jgi:hypothetical protein
MAPSLRVVVFAAATSEGAPAYDGVVIEWVDPAPAPTVRAPAPGSGGQRRATAR